MTKTHLTHICMRLFWVSLLVPFAASAQSESKPGVQGTMILQSAETSTFALPLGDVGRGPNQQDMTLFQFGNLFKKSDGLTLYGWQTVDLNGIVNWDATALYRIPVVRVGGGTISLGTGVQRWHLPLVAETDDWISDNSLSFDRPGRIPLSFQADTKTTISTNRSLAEGSYLVLSATTSMPLRTIGHFKVSLRHGPTFVEGLGMYGVNGNHAFRYEGGVVVSNNGYNLEFLGRPQIGLQPGLKDSIYWGFTVNKAIHLFGPRE